MLIAAEYVLWTGGAVLEPSLQQPPKMARCGQHIVVSINRQGLPMPGSNKQLSFIQVYDEQAYLWDVREDNKPRVLTPDKRVTDYISIEIVPDASLIVAATKSGHVRLRILYLPAEDIQYVCCPHGQVCRLTCHHSFEASGHCLGCAGGEKYFKCLVLWWTWLLPADPTCFNEPSG